MSSPGIPQIPQPVLDPRAQLQVLLALKQGMESLAGRRGDPMGRAVTFNDLVALGLVSPQAAAVVAKS